MAIISDGRLIEQGEVAWFFSNAKTQLARDFIHSTIHLEVPQEYQDRMSAERVPGSYPLVKLGFTGSTVDTPLISEASRRFNIDISILSADIEYAGASSSASCWQNCSGMKPSARRPSSSSSTTIFSWR